MIKRNVYQEVTARILAQLESGTLPWIRPWSATAGNNVPCNAISNRPYSGINVLLLWDTLNRGFATPRFLTFKQAKESGGHVRAGESGFKVVFVKQWVTKDKTSADENAIHVVPILREYTVFNVAQCDGLPEKIIRGPSVPIVRNKDARDETADAFVASTKADIHFGHGQAMYVPSRDHICMPQFEDFKCSHWYYATLFHELSHWTGHKTRLDRDFKGRFGTAAYAAEELVAELSAAFLCAEFSFDGQCQAASYIATWIQLLKHDARAFFTAASAAQKAADYLRGKALADMEVEQAA